MNGRYRKGWYGESQRHYLAAKGIKTNRYFSLFKPHKISKNKVEFKDHHGRSILYDPELSNADVESIKGETIPSPDDIAYVLDELPPGMAPVDVRVCSQDSNFKSENKQLFDRKRKIEAEIKELTDRRVRGGEVTDKELRELWAAKNQVMYDIREGRHNYKRLSGTQTGGEDEIKLYTKQSGDFHNLKQTIVHESAHAIGDKDGREKRLLPILREGYGVYDDEEFDFKSPTWYGDKSKKEAFAETVAAIKAPLPKEYDDEGNFIRDRQKEEFKWDNENITPDKDDWEVRHSQDDFERAKKWLPEKIPAWSAPSSRQEYEADPERNPVKLMNEGFTAHALERRGVQKELDATRNFRQMFGDKDE